MSPTDSSFKIVVLTVFIAVFFQSCCLSFKHYSHGSSYDKCSKNTATLQSLFRLVCSRASNMTNIQSNCTACFLTALNANQGRASLTQLSTCANVFLANSNFTECARVLMNDIANNNLGRSLLFKKDFVYHCPTKYCGFVRCLRRINSDLLISDCYAEATRVTNVTTNNATRVDFYKNVTACILARARCDPTNPVTGESQMDRFTSSLVDKWGEVYRLPGVRVSNTLQVTASGDLRIVSFPETAPIVQYLCSDQTVFDEAGWTNVNCS